MLKYRELQKAEHRKKVFIVIKSQNLELLVQFYAIGFAEESLPQSVYLRATVLACPKDQTCVRQDCQAVTVPIPQRRRRNAPLQPAAAPLNVRV